MSVRVTPLQRSVLAALGLEALTLDEIKGRIPSPSTSAHGGHGVTQAVNALVAKRLLVQGQDGRYRRGRRL